MEGCAIIFLLLSIGVASDIEVSPTIFDMLSGEINKTEPKSTDMMKNLISQISDFKYEWTNMKERTQLLENMMFERNYELFKNLWENWPVKTDTTDLEYDDTTEDKSNDEDTTEDKSNCDGYTLSNHERTQIENSYYNMQTLLKTGIDSWASHVNETLKILEIQTGLLENIYEAKIKFCENKNCINNVNEWGEKMISKYKDVLNDLKSKLCEGLDIFGKFSYKIKFLEYKFKKEVNKLKKKFICCIYPMTPTLALMASMCSSMEYEEQNFEPVDFDINLNEKSKNKEIMQTSSEPSVQKYNKSNEIEE